jgi:predicted permease
VILARALRAGLAPAFTSSRPTLGDAHKTGAGEGGGRRSRLRSLLIIPQAALSVMLLVGAGLCAASFRRATTIDMGMDADRIVLARPDFSVLTKDSATYEVRWREAMERVRTIPGVTSVSQSVTTPFESQWTTDIFTAENGKLPPLKGGGPYANAVTPEYFTTMGTTLLRGRGFTASDVPGAAPVTIINEAMARAIWPGQEALGRCFKIDADTVPCTTVVGIVRNSRMTELKEAPPPHYYVPLAQWSPDMRMLFVRVERDPQKLVKDVREKLQSISSLLPYTDVRTMGEVLEPELRPWRLGATMFGLFGLLAFVVAVLGTYSVVAYEVSQRRREIGVRMALGARSGQVLRGVIGDGLRQASVGVTVGILLALVATRWLGDLLFQTSPREPAIYAGVALLLLAAAAVASLVPARDAARLDPAEVLKGD